MTNQLTLNFSYFTEEEYQILQNFLASNDVDSESFEQSLDEPNSNFGFNIYKFARNISESESAIKIAQHYYDNNQKERKLQVEWGPATLIEDEAYQKYEWECPDYGTRPHSERGYEGCKKKNSVHYIKRYRRDLQRRK